MSKIPRSLSLIVALILFAHWMTGCDTPPAADAPPPTATHPVVEENGLPDEGDPPPAMEEDVPLEEEDASPEKLSIDIFFDEAFKQIMLRNPEWVSAEGLDEAFGVSGDQLTPLSPAYMGESQALYREILTQLETYDRKALSPEQQISYDVFAWYLDDLIRRDEFARYDYPIVHFTVGVQYDLIYFFTDLHPLANKQDAENYIARLSQVDDKFGGLIEGLHLSEEAEIVAPQFIWQWSMGMVRNLANAPARNTPFYEAFAAKVALLDDASDAEKEAMLEAAETAVAESVTPAFGDLLEAMHQMQAVAPTDDGVWQFENGDAYYAYTLHHHTTTNMTADEIHALGLVELERIHNEIYAAFEELGYPTEDASLAELYDQLEQEGGKVSGAQIGETFEELAAEAEANIDAAFDIRPQAPFTVIAGDMGDFYVSASLDGTRPGVFYAQTGSGSQNYAGMPTLLYHEGIPGHHFQISIAQEADQPLFRNAIGFTGYIEGWALYAERLASDLDWYADDPHGNLGRLQMEAFRAARLVVDTGIHAQGWNFEQAHAFMEENVGLNRGDNVNAEFEVSRYIAWPGQATAYMVGMLKLLELRDRAMDALGDQFDQREFHNVVLTNGSMPLDVLETVVEQYIETHK
ncbi:MAG: DUF885 domain-containing protein [Chloroflexi bacterium]|nr:DUF885 domain-containing protein [Chloroflexota bacterium]